MDGRWVTTRVSRHAQPCPSQWRGASPPRLVLSRQWMIPMMFKRLTSLVFRSAAESRRKYRSSHPSDEYPADRLDVTAHGRSQGVFGRGSSHGLAVHVARERADGQDSAGASQGKEVPNDQYDAPRVDLLFGSRKPSTPDSGIDGPSVHEPRFIES